MATASTANGPVGRRQRLSTLSALVLAIAFTSGSADHGEAQESDIGWAYPILVNDDGRDARQHSPAATVDTAGGVHAVWIDYRHGGTGGDVFYSHLPAGSSSWEPNSRVAGGGDKVARTSPDVAVDSQGGAHVVWAEARGATPDIRHSVRPGGSRVWSDSVRVNDEHGSAAQIEPRIVADNWGSVHLVWVDYRSGPAQLFHGQRLYDGQWMPNIRVTDMVQGVQEHPDLAITKRGDVYAFWEESRDGRTNIYASRLPPGSDVWWPPHELSAGPSTARQHSVSAAADSAGTLHAVWIDDTGSGSLRASSLPMAEEMWLADRIVYQVDRGALVSTSVAAGPGGQSVVVWGETRPDGWRLYSGVLGSGEVRPERVDGSPSVLNSLQPTAVMDTAAGVHKLWTGTRRPSVDHILHARGALPAPQRESVEYRGFVQYRYGEWNCAGDGYMMFDCEGGNSPFVLPGGLDLSRHLGSYVVLSGVKVDESSCIHVKATGVRREAAPCPRTTGSVSGLLSGPNGPVWGAHVFLGEAETYTGPTGRYFFEQVEVGGYPLTATLDCGLMMESEGVRVLARPVTGVPDAEFVVGEVVDDCRIDVRDMVRVTAQYKARPPFNPACSDQDGDGTVGLDDVVIVASSYGATCPTPWGGSVLGGESLSDLPDNRPKTGVLRKGSHDLVLRTDASGVFGWSAELTYDSSQYRPYDTDPSIEGVQPFDESSLPAGSWVVENVARERDGRGEMLLAATLVAPDRPLGPRVILGAVQLIPAAGSPQPPAATQPPSAAVELADYRLLSSKGRVVPGTVELESGSSRQRWDRLWLPWLER